MICCGKQSKKNENDIYTLNSTEVIKIVNDFITSKIDNSKIREMAIYIETLLEKSKFADSLPFNFTEKILRRMVILQSLLLNSSDHGVLKDFIGKMTHERFEYCATLLEHAIAVHLDFNPFYTDIILHRFAKYSKICCDFDYYDKLSFYDIHKFVTEITIKTNEFYNNVGNKNTYLFGVDISSNLNPSEAMYIEAMTVDAIIKDTGFYKIIPENLAIPYNSQKYEQYKHIFRQSMKSNFSFKDEFTNIIETRLDTLENFLKFRKPPTSVTIEQNKDIWESNLWNFITHIKFDLRFWKNYTQWRMNI